MTNQNQEYLQGLEKIVDMFKVDSGGKEWLKYKAGSLKKNPDGSPINELQYLAPEALGGIISPTDPELFLNETQTFVENEINNYQETKAKDVNGTLNKYKNQLISDYVEGANKIISQNTKKIKSDLEKKIAESNIKLTPEQKKELVKANLEQSLYQLIGKLIKDLDLTEDYKGNKDLVEAVNGLRELDSIDESERQNTVADLVIKKDGLTDNYRNARRDWNGSYEGMRMNYVRVIGKQLLNEENGNYSIKEKLLKEAYGNVEAVKKMSPIIKAKYAKKAS